MRVRFTLLCVSMAALCQGCNLASVACHVVGYRTIQCIDDYKERVRNRHWARQAWEDFARGNAETPYSPDFAAGFEEGFAVYLYRGGSTEPPPLPPNKYHRPRYQTPEGYRAIQDWFAGYKVGATEAQHSDYRRWVTGPSALRAAGEEMEHAPPPAPPPSAPPSAPPPLVPPPVAAPPAAPAKVAPPAFAPPPAVPTPVVPPASAPSPSAASPSAPSPSAASPSAPSPSGVSPSALSPSAATSARPRLSAQLLPPISPPARIPASVDPPPVPLGQQLFAPDVAGSTRDARPTPLRTTGGVSASYLP